VRSILDINYCGQPVSLVAQSGCRIILVGVYIIIRCSVYAVRHNRAVAVGTSCICGIYIILYTYAYIAPITKSATRLIGENDVSRGPRGHSASKIVLLRGPRATASGNRVPAKRSVGRTDVVVTALSTAQSAARQLCTWV